MPTAELWPRLTGSEGGRGWLSGMDSNHDKELQRLLCYHYTTGQDGYILTSWLDRRKGKAERTGNPKAEIRRPKEARNPKSEKSMITLPHYLALRR
jgi:hypothetical protein